MVNAKYAAKYQKTVDAIANHIQRDCNGGPEIAKAIKDMLIPVINVPPYPTPANPGDEVTQKPNSSGSKRFKRP